MKPLMFHVRHNAKPDLVREVIQILGREGLESIESFLEGGKQRGFQIGTTILSKQSIKENSIQSARDLGLVEASSLCLSQLGLDMLTLLEYKPAVFNELMHLFHYFLWTPIKEADNCFSWSYKTTCDMLWENEHQQINRAQLVSDVCELAIGQFKTNQVSFSKDSVRGVLQWLNELEPPVLDEGAKTFMRRRFCPPEAIAYSVDRLYQAENIEYQTNLLIDGEKREMICRSCLLDPTAFDTILDWATGQYDFLQKRTGGGWGTHILLTRKPQVMGFP